MSFSRDQVGTKVGDRLIHELVLYTGSTDDEERQIRAIEIT